MKVNIVNALASQAGAAHVVMDFTEGRLAPRNDPRNPWTTRHLLPFFIELDNRVLDRFSAEERKSIGVHLCPGVDVDSVHSADVPYEELLKHLFKLGGDADRRELIGCALQRRRGLSRRRTLGLGPDMDGRARPKPYRTGVRYRVRQVEHKTELRGRCRRFDERLDC